MENRKWLFSGGHFSLFKPNESASYRLNAATLARGQLPRSAKIHKRPFIVLGLFVGPQMERTFVCSSKLVICVTYHLGSILGQK